MRLGVEQNTMGRAQVPLVVGKYALCAALLASIFFEVRTQPVQEAANFVPHHNLARETDVIPPPPDFNAGYVS